MSARVPAGLRHVLYDSSDRSAALEAKRAAKQREQQVEFARYFAECLEKAYNATTAPPLWDIQHRHVIDHLRASLSSSRDPLRAELPPALAAEMADMADAVELEEKEHYMRAAALLRQAAAIWEQRSLKKN